MQLENLPQTVLGSPISALVSVRAFHLVMPSSSNSATMCFYMTFLSIPLTSRQNSCVPEFLEAVCWSSASQFILEGDTLIYGGNVLLLWWSSRKKVGSSYWNASKPTIPTQSVPIQYWKDGQVGVKHVLLLGMVLYWESCCSVSIPETGLDWPSAITCEGTST